MDDNFRYLDDDERYLAAECDTEEEALSAARRKVDDFLRDSYRPGMDAKELHDQYTGFGEDPFIMLGYLSAWTYAEAMCAEICGR